MNAITKFCAKERPWKMTLQNAWYPPQQYTDDTEVHSQEENKLFNLQL